MEEEEEEAVEFEGEEVEGEEVAEGEEAGGGESGERDEKRRVEAELEEAEDRAPKRRAVSDELDEVVDSASLGHASVLPAKMAGLRSCMICKLVKNESQFEERGCDNCDRFVRMQGDRERVHSITTTRFSGFAGLMGDSRSWVARYQRQQPNSVPAIYSSSTKGKVSDEIRETLEEAGYTGFMPE